MIPNSRYKTLLSLAAATVEDSPNAKQGYHYYKNAGTSASVGNSLGWAMADLLKAAK